MAQNEIDQCKYQETQLILYKKQKLHVFFKSKNIAGQSFSYSGEKRDFKKL
jgi:hypothetical protein